MQIKSLITSFVAAAALMFTAQANADVMADLVSGPGAGGSSFTNVHPSVIGGAGYTKGTGLNFPTGTFANYTVNGATSTTQAGAVTASDFNTWGLSFNQPWNLDSFSLRYGRSSTGPTALRVQIAINGGAFTDTALLDTTVSDAGEEVLNVDLSSFDNVTSVSFRAVIWNGASTGTFSFLNSANIGNASFRLNASAVPEPATAGLLGLAGLAMLRRRRA